MTNGNYKVVIPKSGKIYSQNSCIDGTDISESIEIKHLKNQHEHKLQKNAHQTSV